MKWKLCKCEIRGLIRPENGPVRIKKTDVKTKDVLVARLDGPVPATVACVRTPKGYFVIAPKKLGGTMEVPADSLTDGLHAAVWTMNDEITHKNKVESKKVDRKKQVAQIKNRKIADRIDVKKKAT
jgi:hypothetical protein